MYSSYIHFYCDTQAKDIVSNIVRTFVDCKSMTFLIHDVNEKSSFNCTVTLNKKGKDISSININCPYKGGGIFYSLNENYQYASGLGSLGRSNVEIPDFLKAILENYQSIHDYIQNLKNSEIGLKDNKLVYWNKKFKIVITFHSNNSFSIKDIKHLRLSIIDNNDNKVYILSQFFLSNS